MIRILIHNVNNLRQHASILFEKFYIVKTEKNGIQYLSLTKHNYKNEYS